MKSIAAAATLLVAAVATTPADAFIFDKSSGSVARFRSARYIGAVTVQVYPSHVGCFAVLGSQRGAPSGINVPNHAVPLTLTVEKADGCRYGYGPLHNAIVYPNTSQFDVKLIYVDQGGRYLGSEQVPIGNR